MADRMLAREPAGHILQPTALVNEAFVRLEGAERLGRRGRAYFFGAAAQAMRRILVEHARKLTAGRGRPPRVPLSPEGLPDSTDGFTSENLLALDEALEGLSRHDEQSHEVVMLKFFAGLTVADIAELLDVSSRTVNRFWTYGRTWLYARLVGSVD